MVNKLDYSLYRASPLLQSLETGRPGSRGTEAPAGWSRGPDLPEPQCPRLEEVNAGDAITRQRASQPTGLKRVKQGKVFKGAKAYKLRQLDLKALASLCDSWPSPKTSVVPQFLLQVGCHQDEMPGVVFFFGGVILEKPRDAYLTISKHLDFA